MKEPETRWLTNPSTILISIVFLAAWQAIGFNTVLFLAGLQGVPRILYEAAYVDGANRWKQFRHVTLPMLAPTTFFVVVTTIITGLQVFNEPYALLSSRILSNGRHDVGLLSVSVCLQELAIWLFFGGCLDPVRADFRCHAHPVPSLAV